MSEASERHDRIKKIHEDYRKQYSTMKLIYMECCHVGCWEILEDEQGVFWEEVDGPPLRRIEENCRNNSSPKMIDNMRKYGVPEETIQRIVAQCGQGEGR
jgi:hypothetical protein